MPKLTKDDVKALRTCDRISIHLTEKWPEGRVILIKEYRIETDGVFESRKIAESERDLPATVNVYGLYRLDDVKSGAAKCFELLYLYHSQHTPASSIVRTLREDDELTFQFYPDAHSNGYCAKAGLHGDALQLIVYRNGQKHATWELATSICPNNTARMCYGFPDSDSYKNSANW